MRTTVNIQIHTCVNTTFARRKRADEGDIAERCHFLGSDFSFDHVTITYII